MPCSSASRSRSSSPTLTESTHPRPRDPEELGFETIVYEKAPPRATITLNRPEVLNAFDFRMLRELARACEDASWDDEIRALVVTGTGRAFCVGADLKSWSADYLGEPREYWKWFGAFKDAHDRLREIGKPTLARINGICVGGGNELQMACDLAVMVEDAFIRHVGRLARKLPQTTRYAKQPLNFWRDLAWHETINHARDWLALSMATDEPRAAIERFLKK